jgi:spore germination cell wall hydrolase CwlJ-like protein
MKLLLLAILLASSLLANKQIECLTLAIYFEARGSNLADQAAVADVILNRVESSRYPNTICKVVKQGRYWKGNPIKHQCQFSFWCDGKSDRMLDLDAKASATLLAVQVAKFSKFRGISEGATHYFANYIEKPYWAKNMYLVGTIGAHKYYRSHKKLSKFKGALR